MKNMSRKHLKMIYRANKVDGDCPMYCGFNVNAKVFHTDQHTSSLIFEWFARQKATVEKKLTKICSKNRKARLYGTFGGYVVK